MQGIPFEFRSYFRNEGWGWPRIFLGLEARSGRTHRVKARALEWGRVVDRRLRDGPGLSEQSLECSHCCSRSPAPYPPRTCDGAQEQSWQVESICLQSNEAFVLDVVFSCFFFFCQYVTKYMNLEVRGRTKKWQKLRSYKPQGPRGREYDEVSLESSCSCFNHLNKSSRIRRYADSKCNFSQSNQVVTETGTSSMIDINTISIQFCISSNRI